MRKTRRIPILKEEDTDPLSVVVNLFDVAMVFAVSLMVAMVMNMNMSEFFSDENFSIVKQKGKLFDFRLNIIYVKFFLYLVFFSIFALNFT